MSGVQAGAPAEFAGRMLRMMNEAALALMVSVGHRTGLFDIMAAMPAATSAEIASRASLDERYVREWLAVMTTGRIVEHDGVAGSYSLPAGHAAWLTRAAGMDNLSGTHRPSFGFRPGRSACQAVRAARRYIKDGLEWVADIDLDRFFDRVQFDVLVARVARKVADRADIMSAGSFANAARRARGGRLVRPTGAGFQETGGGHRDPAREQRFTRRRVAVVGRLGCARLCSRAGLGTGKRLNARLLRK